MIDEDGSIFSYAHLSPYFCELITIHDDAHNFDFEPVNFYFWTFYLLLNFNNFPKNTPLKPFLNEFLAINLIRQKSLKWNLSNKFNHTGTECRCWRRKGKKISREVIKSHPHSSNPTCVHLKRKAKGKTRDKEVCVIWNSMKNF